jgi:hypothetical protein
VATGDIKKPYQTRFKNVAGLMPDKFLTLHGPPRQNLVLAAHFHEKSKKEPTACYLT